MCGKSENEIRELLKDLPDIPVCALSYMEEGDFHGVIGWEVVKGKMLSFPLLSYDSCEVLHMQFGRNTQMNWHDHGNESDQLIVCLIGEISILLEDGTQRLLKPTDRMEIKKGVKHMAVIGNKPCEIIAMTIPRERHER